MSKPFAFPLLEHPEELARLGNWSAEVYRDLLAYQQGRLAEPELRRKYCHTVAIMQLDMTGMTETAMRGGPLLSFVRVLDAQKVCVPALLANGAVHVRAFADDLTATFAEPSAALDAALEIHRRMEALNAAQTEPARRVSCCIGLGYGEVLAIGPDRAMGDEMNRASKLGEDTAKAGETLITEAFYDRVRDRAGVRFERRTNDELPFAFFSVARG
jgi:class 3 adenylate cyclase